ncbi:hypothetical protein GCM10009107_13040 [Ideonella azotifigens]|uniref:Uncharacterized protein n=1 Tax=Ideonella azotifigens TaxID=513160 RepID=A0ABN1JSR6_9BURK
MATRLTASNALMAGWTEEWRACIFKLLVNRSDERPGPRRWDARTDLLAVRNPPGIQDIPCRAARPWPVDSLRTRIDRIVRSLPCARLNRLHIGGMARG